MKKIGQGTYSLGAPVYVTGYSAIVGEKEKQGPLGDRFDLYSNDEYFGETTFEQAESTMQKEVLLDAIRKKKYKPTDLDFIFAGDLLNQCIGSNYGLRDIGVPYFGIYGACSTMGEGLILASMAIDGGFATRTANLASSHFCSAERQFRFPLEYGNQRAPSAQWTVTGAGCVLLSGVDISPVRVTRFCPGTVCDMGVTDMGNMGAAMAPAAAQTLKRFFEDTHTVPTDYDLIVSGDLGEIGHRLVIDLLARDGIALDERYTDCGLLIYDCEKQDVHAGGSGCGCSASVLCGYLLPELEKGTWRKILFMPTGALMSPTSSLQGETIPGIAHLVALEVFA